MTSVYAFLNRFGYFMRALAKERQYRRVKFLLDRQEGLSTLLTFRYSTRQGILNQIFIHLLCYDQSCQSSYCITHTGCSLGSPSSCTNNRWFQGQESPNNDEKERPSKVVFPQKYEVSSTINHTGRTLSESLRNEDFHTCFTFLILLTCFQIQAKIYH